MPLLVIDKGLHKESLKCFKSIQRIMDDSKLSHSNRVLEIQGLVEKGIQSTPLRDEIYVQIIKVDFTLNLILTNISNFLKILMKICQKQKSISFLLIFE